MRAEMPYGIVRLIDRRQPAIFTALPPTAFLLRKNSAGLFDEGKSDDDKEESRRNTCVFQGSMTQSALICAWGPRKVARPCGVRRTHHSGEGCPLGSARLKRRLRPTKKRVCPCQAKVSYQNATFINSATQHRMMASGTYTYRPMPYHSAPRRFLLPVLTAASSASFFIT